MESTRAPAPLQRQVLPPRRADNGLGVLIVASMAMFFAVMSSAFVLQVRSARQCPQSASAPTIDLGDLGDLGVADAPSAHAQTSTEALVAPPALECGQPMYRQNRDGSVTVFYEVCPTTRERDWSLRSAEVPALEVRRIR